MSDINDGGPAFPIIDMSQNQATGETTVFQCTVPGMSKRELFAVKLLPVFMQNFWKGLDEQQYACPPDWRDGVAQDACLQADALLRALAEPRPPEPKYRDLTPMEEDELRIGRGARAVLESAKADPAFEQLTPALRQRITETLHAFADAEIPF